MKIEDMYKVSDIKNKLDNLNEVIKKFEELPNDSKAGVVYWEKMLSKYTYIKIDDEEFNKEFLEFLKQRKQRFLDIIDSI